jgi:hypothetical protein
MESKTFWEWQVKDPSGRWRRLAWRMTEEVALEYAEREGKELRKVPGSAEIRQPDDRSGGLMSQLGTSK